MTGLPAQPVTDKVLLFQHELSCRDVTAGRPGMREPVAAFASRRSSTGVPLRVPLSG